MTVRLEHANPCERVTVRLEHANLCVRDIDEMIRFLQISFLAFRIRRDAIDADGTRWVHVGTDDTYITLNQSTAEPQQRWLPYEGKPGTNHLGFEVDDVEQLRERGSELQAMWILLYQTLTLFANVFISTMLKVMTGNL